MWSVMKKLYSTTCLTYHFLYPRRNKNLFLNEIINRNTNLISSANNYTVVYNRSHNLLNIVFYKYKGSLYDNVYVKEYDSKNMVPSHKDGVTCMTTPLCAISLEKTIKLGPDIKISQMVVFHNNCIYFEEYSIMILTENNRIFVIGSNNYGQFGNIPKEKIVSNGVEKFTEIKFNNESRPVKISGGNGHSMVLFEDGELYASGDNSCGQLGLGKEGKQYDNKINRNMPINYYKFQLIKKKKSKYNIRDVICSDYNTFILLDNGSIQCCGSNYRGKLGTKISDAKCIYKFKKIDVNRKKVVKLCASRTKTVILFSDRTLAISGNTEGHDVGNPQYTCRKNVNTFTTLYFDTINFEVADVILNNRMWIFDKNGDVFSEYFSNLYSEKITHQKYASNVVGIAEVLDEYHIYLIK